MSTRELDRLQVLGRVAEKRLTQREAAVILGVTDRQLRRIWRRYQAEGPTGLVSKRRGRPSNRRLPSKLRELSIALVRHTYHDFDPTFAHEKLTEKHGLELSVSTLRYGKPVAFYSDKASVFRVNAKDPRGGDGYTQFGRAMSQLNIDTMCANTQQAKGRVEYKRVMYVLDKTEHARSAMHKRVDIHETEEVNG